MKRSVNHAIAAAVLGIGLAGGIVVEGNGNASTGLLPQVPWVKEAETLIYWGDIDQKGFEIVHGLRSRMRQLRTVLIDPPVCKSSVECDGTCLQNCKALVESDRILIRPFSNRLIADLNFSRIQLTGFLIVGEALAAPIARAPKQ